MNNAISTIPDSFAEDVLKGLTSFPKYLSSKYFYNKKGNELFEQIMHSTEYYLTDCEKEIFENQSDQLLNIILNDLAEFDIIELGPGDCYKSIHLLKAVRSRKLSSTFYPIDISGDVINHLEQYLPSQLPGFRIKGMTGEYIASLKKIHRQSSDNKLILFLGSSIGNIPPGEDVRFFKAIRDQMKKGDMLLTGFDLQKNPKIILSAYNDKAGFTRAFNLNLLQRINDVLKSNFVLSRFDHYPAYDPETGTCKSYLISLQKQQVHLGNFRLNIPFEKDESILMEISQKYTLSQINAFALQSGFEPVQHFMDSRKWFTDALWKAV